MSITPAQGLSRLGNPPSSGSTPLLIRKRCSMGHNASSFQDYREIHQFSQPKLLAIRSTPKMQRHVSDLSASPRQGVQRESVRLRPNGSLCTHCHDGVVRPGTEHRTTWRERASNGSEPLIRVLAPCNQELKRRYAPLNNASETEGRLDPRQGGFPRRERPWAAVIDKRAVAEPSCPPAAQAKRTIGSADIQSASVSAQAA